MTFDLYATREKVISLLFDFDLKTFHINIIKFAYGLAVTSFFYIGILLQQNNEWDSFQTFVWAFITMIYAAIIGNLILNFKGIIQIAFLLVVSFTMAGQVHIVPYIVGGMMLCLIISVIRGLNKEVKKDGY